MLVSDLVNLEVLIRRHKKQLTNEGLYKKIEIDNIINDRFLNSRVGDIEYLLKDLQVEIINGKVINKKGSV